MNTRGPGKSLNELSWVLVLEKRSERWGWGRGFISSGLFRRHRDALGGGKVTWVFLSEISVTPLLADPLASAPFSPLCLYHHGLLQCFFGAISAPTKGKPACIGLAPGISCTPGAEWEWQYKECTPLSQAWAPKSWQVAKQAADITNP